MNPIKILGFETSNGYNIVTHIDLNKNYLTAQNNHFGIYLYANNYQPYTAPFFNATFIAVFENGTSNSNDYSSSAFAICDYVGLNSNGFTLFGYSNDTQLISYTIKTHLIQYTRVLTSNTIDTTANYDIVCENLNDYIYFDIYSSQSGSDTTHYEFIIDSKNTTAPSSVTYSNNNYDEIVTVASGNSLCRTSTEDTRLTYFNPVDGLVIDTTTDIYYGYSGFYVFSSYPNVASGVIYSLSTDNTANILTPNTYTSNITTTGLDIINNAISLINFSDNVSILASNDGYLFYVYNVDSNGTINQSESITNELYNYTYINTPTTVIWPVTNNSCNVSYTSYNITTQEFILYNDSNLYYNNYVIRTNNYYTWYD